MADNDFRVKQGIVVGGDAFISNSITSVNSISFVDTQEFEPGRGSLAWSNTEGALALGLTDTLHTHLNQDSLYYVINQSGFTIPANTVVMANGTVGNSGSILVSPAIGNGTFPSDYVMGIATHNIANGDEGYVTAFGKVRGINTSMFSEGDILYLNPAVPGTMMNTAPVAPNNKVTVAIVVTKGVNNGELFVRPSYADKLSQLQDVAILDGISNGQSLLWVAANSRFENKNVTSTSFSTIAVSGQSNVVADSSSDTLTFAAGSGIQISTDPSTDTVTITNTGGSGGSGGLIAGDYVVRANKNGSSQTVTSGADAVVTLVDDFDPQNWFASNKFQPTVAGYYSLTAQVWWDAGAVTNNQTNVQIRKNGNIQLAINQDQIMTGSGYAQALSTIAYFNGSTDYVEVTAFTGNTTSQNINGAAGGTYFTAALYAYGDASNAWVNANTYNTLLTARANDYNSFTTLTANTYNTLLAAQANDFNSFTTLTANTYNTLLAAQSNDGVTLASARANDFNSYTTLTANDYNSYTTLTANTYNTLLAAQANDVATLNSARANDFSTFTTLTANTYNSYLTLTANDGATLLSALSNDGATLDSARANDYNSFTTLTANTYNTLLDTRANDYNSFTTLTANIYNTFAYLNANVGGGGDASNAWVNANDYNSYTTLTANIYDTYTSLFANLGVGGGNVTNTVSITPIFSGALRTTNATQTLGAASWTTLTGYDNVIYDTNSFTSVADRFTIPAGVTKVKLAGSVAGTSAIGQLITRILKNANTAISYTTEVDIESTGADNGVAITPVVSVVEGDYFVIQAFSDNSRTVSVDLVSWFSLEVVEGSVLTATANLTISSAGNAWVNANDFSTYSTLTANSYNTLLAAYSNDLATLNSARANDFNSFTTVTANTYNTLLAAQANDFTTFSTLSANDGVTLATARGNDHSTLLSAQANDYATLLTAQANDFNSYTTLTANDYNSFTTLTANIYNTFAYLNANVGGGGGDVANAWVNANDYSTFTTLTANIYNTFAYLNANVGGEVSQYSQKFTVTGSTNTFTLSNSVSSEESILVYIDGIVQHNDAYVVSGTTLTIANTLPLPTSTLGIRRLSGTSGSSTGGLSYLRTYALG